MFQSASQEVTEKETSMAVEEDGRKKGRKEEIAEREKETEQKSLYNRFKRVNRYCI